MQSIRRVFISSTVQDLQAFREKVRSAIAYLGQFAVDMADFGARDDDAKHVSLDELRKSDIYIGIIAWRYGSIPKGETRSVTHLEYEEAKRLNIPRFLFLAHPETINQDRSTDLFPAELRDTDHKGSILEFRAEIERERVVDYFTTPDELAREVTSALSSYLLAHPDQPTPQSLPPRSPSFVDRTQELQTIIDTLQQAQSQGLSAIIVGMGGVGKSALAAEVLHSIREADPFPGGIAWINCEGKSDIVGLLWIYEQIFANWGINIRSFELEWALTPQLKAEAYEHILRLQFHPKGRILIFLDNVEAGLQLSHLLDVLGSLNIITLITSRTAFYSPRLQLIQLDVLPPIDAQRLFIERYQAQGQLSDESVDEDAIRNIVDILGFLPLAIELAAARAARMRFTPSLLNQEMQQSDILSLLRDPLDPIANVRYALRKSLETLTADQQLQFAVLSLAHGPDIPEFVAKDLFVAISGSEGQSTNDDLALFASLSLLSFISDSLGERRIYIHPLLHELAAEQWKLEPQSIRQRASIALLNSIQGFVYQHKKEFIVLARDESLIVDAIYQAIEARLAADRCAAIIGDLEQYCRVGGHWHLGLTLNEQMLAFADELQDIKMKANALQICGNMRRLLGEYDKANADSARALAYYEALEDKQNQARTLFNMGTTYRAMSQYEDAARALQRSLALHEQIGNHSSESNLLNSLGYLAYSQGNYADALSYFTRSLRIRESADDRVGQGQSLNNLGLLAFAQQHYDEANDYYERALVLRRETHNRSGESATLNNLGKLAYMLHHYDKAEELCRQSLRIRQEIGDRAGEAQTINTLGQIAAARGRYELAEQTINDALAIRRTIHDKAGEGHSLADLGNIKAKQHQDNMATTLYEQAITIFTELNLPNEAERVRSSVHRLRTQKHQWFLLGWFHKKP
jgi:tetratricopeptide (TPR) repeat protein